MKKKLQKIKRTWMNEHEISTHVNNKSQIQTVQPEITTWKYKVKLSAEAASGHVLQKTCF